MVVSDCIGVVGGRVDIVANFFIEVDVDFVDIGKVVMVVNILDGVAVVVKILPGIYEMAIK